MLKGFANDNRGFMNRTRAINQNFANAIGSTTANKECRYENVIVGYSPTGSGEPIIERRLICKTPTAKFDGGFANAIGTPTKFNPVGYVPSKCVGGRCASGMCCLKNGTNVATGVTADWCIPCSDFQKFDGGFSNAIGKTTYTKPTNPDYSALPSCGGHTSTNACLSCPQFNSTMQSAQGCPIAEGNYSTAWGSIGETFLKNSCGCSYNPPLSTTTKPTTTNVSAKFDGGFNYVNGGCGDNGFLGL